MEFDPQYFESLAAHSTDYLSYGDVLVYVTASNLWAFVLHGVINDGIIGDLKRRGYQVVWAREPMGDMLPCTVNQYYVGQRVLEFSHYAII